MDPKEFLLLVACLGLLGELRLTSTTTTTTFVAAMSIANQDLERYFRTTNTSQTLAAMTEERIAMDMYTYAYLNYSYLNAQHTFVQIKYDEEKARYGEGRVLEPRGKLVHISDINGADNRTSGTDFACSANIRGTNGDPTPEPGIMWIALVRRGRCTFEEKVMHVHAKGAAGVIIYNDKPVTNLEKMQIKGKNRNITAVITYHDIGLNMTHILDQGFDVTAAIIEGRSGMRPIHTMNRTSVLFVSISFIVLMIISLVWLVFYYIQRFRYLQTKDQQSRHLCSVTKKAIMKIPTKTGKVSDEKDADSDCCAICIEAYKPSDCIRVLPCKHEFHKNCIDPWLIEHRTCPMCKLDVLKFYGFVVGDQITSSPNPVHQPPNIPSPPPPTHISADELDVAQVQVVPVLVGVATQVHTQTQTQMQPEPNTLNSSSCSSSGSNSSSGANSSSNRNNFSETSNSINRCNDNSNINNSNNHNNNNNNSNISNSSSSCPNSSSNSSAHVTVIDGNSNNTVAHLVTASRQVTDV